MFASKFGNKIRLSHTVELRTLQNFTIIFNCIFKRSSLFLFFEVTLQTTLRFPARLNIHSSH